jgi:hypothetical protein
MIGWWVATALAAAPDPFASCEEQHAFYDGQTRERPQIRPTLWWIEEELPCPIGTILVGNQPPEGQFVGCQDRRGRRYGPRTEFGPTGKVAIESRWERNRELGPRLEWSALTYEVSRVSLFKDGRLDGESLSWLDDEGLLVSTFRRGLRDGPTLRLDAHGNLQLVEGWRLDLRHGRVCSWHDGELMVDQVYYWGEPETLPAPDEVQEAAESPAR